MKTMACLNGQILPADEAKVSIWDRAFLFGDSVYEVFRLYGGRCWLEDAHYRRLERSVGALALRGVDLPRLKKRVQETIAASGIAEGLVYIQITRGVAMRQHHYPGPDVPPTELVIVWPYDDTRTAQARETGVKTISRPDIRWGLCDIKSTNLLPNVMANEAAHQAGGFEAILYGDDGLVSEATHSSVLWVRGGKLEGTPQTHGILPGTTRHLLVQLAREESVPYGDARITLDELKRAEEAILVGTSIEILPIVQVDDTLISGGRPGSITRRLQAAYQRAVERWLAG